MAAQRPLLEHAGLGLVLPAGVTARCHPYGCDDPIYHGPPSGQSQQCGIFPGFDGEPVAAQFALLGFLRNL